MKTRLLKAIGCALVRFVGIIIGAAVIVSGIVWIAGLVTATLILLTVILIDLFRELFLHCWEKYGEEK